MLDTKQLAMLRGALAPLQGGHGSGMSYNRATHANTAGRLSCHLIAGCKLVGSWRRFPSVAIMLRHSGQGLATGRAAMVIVRQFRPAVRTFEVTKDSCLGTCSCC